MLFSSPDYPLFLIAVFFLYALSRLGGPTGRWARVAVMVILGDLVYMLIAKDPALLWDPIGSIAYQLAANGGIEVPDATTIAHWLVGASVLEAARYQIDTLTPMPDKPPKIGTPDVPLLSLKKRS